MLSLDSANRKQKYMSKGWHHTQLPLALFFFHLVSLVTAEQLVISLQAVTEHAGEVNRTKWTRVFGSP